jgi:serine/threonine-protein kinase HipA
LNKYGRPANSLNPVEQLCFIGSRGMGALEFEPSQMLVDKKPFDVELDSLVSAAQSILSNKVSFETKLDQEQSKAMVDILKIGTSAGGARPKAIIAYNEKTKKVKSGQTSLPAGFEHWLIKLDGVGDAQFGESFGYGRVEMAYALMAQSCGIEMMECRLHEENNRAHFMTKRFDREGSKKHHIQSFCALNHFDFNDVLSFSYEQVFQTMRMLNLPYLQAVQMFRRMVFNVLARNCDDHTKNFSFRLKEGGNWELAPAYDVCHAYRPGSIWVSQHALSISGKRQNITASDVLTVANAMNIKHPNQIIEQIQDAVNNWDAFAKEVDVDVKLASAIKTTFPFIK